MNEYDGITDDRTVNWLLEDSNPSVRFFTLKNILGRPESDAEVAEAKGNIMRSGIVAKILSMQQKEGYWIDPKRFYLEKYKGTVWQLMILAELGCTADNEQVKAACEFILDNSQDIQSYGFAVNKSGSAQGGRHSEVIPCLTGNMTWALIRLGYLQDPRVEKAIDWICTYQRCDDGIKQAPTGWPYDRLEVCWGKHSCHMGPAKALKALNAIPEEKRNRAVQQKINDLLEYFLIHHIYKRSHDPEKTAKPGWLRLGFPLMYQTDILELLEIMTSLKIRDPRMNDALEVIKKKRGDNKRWKLENSFNGKMLVDIEEKGKESKWITLKALYILMNNR